MLPLELSVNRADITSVTLTSAVNDKRVYRSKYEIYVGAAWHDPCFSLTTERYSPMRLRLALLLLVLTTPAAAQTLSAPDDAFISPSRPVPVGKAPTMQTKLVKDTPGEQVYSIIFYKADDVMSGLTDFAIDHKVSDAHFTAIGAVSGATLAWLDIPKKMYRRIAVTQQVEVLSLIGDIAVFDGVPVVHMHAVLCKSDGSTIGGHVFELISNPTVEVFMTVNTTPLRKKSDDASGMKLIDPAQ
jgi:uncharacterized protein